MHCLVWKIIFHMGPMMMLVDQIKYFDVFFKFYDFLEYPLSTWFALNVTEKLSKGTYYELHYLIHVNSIIKLYFKNLKEI